MKLAIMQPYLFPYLGYFQLIGAADTFVVYDDVHYIKGGWINRNYLLGPTGRQLFTLPLSGASPNRNINEINISNHRRKLIETLHQRYSKAPYFAEAFPMIEDIFSHCESKLALFLDHSLRTVCAFLELRPHWHLSSDLAIGRDLRGQDRVLAICEALGANHYINAPGGRSLYDARAFAAHGIKLSFLQPGEITYRQFGSDFVPNLSIIDVIMFNSPGECQRMLVEYTLD